MVSCPSFEALLRTMLLNESKLYKNSSNVQSRNL
jgi:hypothetical protein